MSGYEVRKLYAFWVLDNVMMGMGQAREVVDYLRTVNSSALNQITNPELNVIRAGHLRLSEINEEISFLLDRNKEVAESCEKGEIREKAAMSLPAYLIGTYNFLRATEDAYAIEKVDVQRLVEFNERQKKVLDLKEELRREVENGQGNTV